MQVTAKCQDKNGVVLFAVEVRASTVKDALERVLPALNKEFDFCFQAESWASIQVDIKR